MLKPATSIHSRLGTRISALVLLFLGAAAGTSPCWVHNCLIARDRVFLSAHSGINFWIGNNPAANGYPRFPPGLRAGQAAMLQDSIDAAESAAGHSLKRGEVSRYWSAKARDYIKRYPVAWLRLACAQISHFLERIPVRRSQHHYHLAGAESDAFPGFILAWSQRWRCP